MSILYVCWKSSTHRVTKGNDSWLIENASDIHRRCFSIGDDYLTSLGRHWDVVMVVVLVLVALVMMRIGMRRENMRWWWHADEVRHDWTWSGWLDIFGCHDMFEYVLVWNILTYEKTLSSLLELASWLWLPNHSSHRVRNEPAWNTTWQARPSYRIINRHHPRIRLRPWHWGSGPLRFPWIQMMGSGRSRVFPPSIFAVMKSITSNSRRRLVCNLLIEIFRFRSAKHLP